MNNGTASPTNGQFAALAARIITALPKGIQSSGLDISSIMRHTERGDCLSAGIAEMLRMLYNGNAKVIVPEQHVIDCDAQPFVPDGWSVEEHQKGGSFKWDKGNQRSALYLSKGQAGSSYIEGNKLRKELADKGIPVLNANVLDYLRINQHLIPEEWKGKYVFFWGTVYRNRHGNLCVRCLCWGDGRWDWSYRWLGRGWDGNGRPAAVRAS